ncbi:MAG: YidC/Oxa1 family membrane protein insertase [Oscillospiraceae bacterium]|nr:YidC/Oxa1 family membrane protein insertase [Oscillospiraceae bacterium]
MILFELSDIIRVPFGYLLDALYQFTTNYGLALILFSIIVKVIMMPTTVKSKRSMMKMSRLTPKIQEIQKKYENDQQKQNEAMQALYKEEGVSMGGGCLWSLVPLLILFPLYAVIREPLIYILHESKDIVQVIIQECSAEGAGLIEGIKTARDGYAQLIIAGRLFDNPELAQQIVAATADKLPEGAEIAARTLQGMDFSFLGIDLSAKPEYNIFNKEVWSWNWAHIGAFLLPVLATLSQVATMLISQKVNNSLVTNEKGIQDKEAAKNSQANQSTKALTYTMPLMTLFFGFSMPAALSLYWIIQSVVGTVLDNILTIKLRKEYDKEDAERLQKAIEADKAEQEKERIRAERRAANPDGITENTSKKKLQQKQQREQEAAKAAAKKEFNAKRGIVEEEKEKPQAMSGIADRPFCKGRNYDPNRYTSNTTEETE